MTFVVGGAYQGKTEYVKEKYGQAYRVIDSYHLLVKSQLESGKNPMEEAEKLLCEHGEDNLVVISNELGCGIVPTDKFEREYREANGRVNCFLASRADEVIRVICGIGSRIK